jgi:carboxyl-terminal processing protease
MSKFTKALIQNHILFNYATEFRQKNAEITSSEKFKLSEQDLADFKQFMLKQDFSFSSSSEEQLKKWKETTEKEGDFDKIKTEYDAILSKLSSTKEANFEKSKDEIRNILENEIVSRYYFQNGRILNGFTSDKSIEKSIEILQNSSRYNTILKK